MVFKVRAFEFVRFSKDSPYYYPDEFLRDVDLGYNTNLKSISFRSRPDIIASLLAQVTSSEVREVVVDFRKGYIKMLDEVDWDTVVRILDQPNFSKLERLIIPTGYLLGYVDEVRQRMMQRLLPGRARDKLVVFQQWFGNRLR